jgi:hypothetical protein
MRARAKRRACGSIASKCWLVRAASWTSSGITVDSGNPVAWEIKRNLIFSESSTF